MQADLPSARFQHRQNKATSRWRGGLHGSIPCKQIGVVASAQAIHAAQGPDHLEVARSPSTIEIGLLFKFF
ncbi:hypothetical protein V6N11_019350 [Hibiscus sabdariffa]|uniref:Uncharacterized protein n=1 Tax=Hibiscus sabdariffa TaxID=183260 RepID=A0ABR2R239_9ROSI